MATILVLPPSNVPFIDPNTGVVSLVWQNYLLSLTNAASTSFAPADGPYVTYKANASLTNATNLGTQATGYLRQTTAAGIATLSTVAAIPGTDITGAALTKTDDTNVTLTLGGNPATALLRASSLTLGWSGQLGLSRGGTHANMSATGGTSQVLRQSSVGADVTVSQLATTDISGFPTIVASTYTPTLTNVTNLDGSTAFTCQYLRVNSVVMVSGKVNVDPTAAGPTATELGISLPVASNFSATEQCGGTASGAIAQVGGIFADTANDRAALFFQATSTANAAMSFSFVYQII